MRLAAHWDELSHFAKCPKWQSQTNNSVILHQV